MNRYKCIVRSIVRIGFVLTIVWMSCSCGNPQEKIVGEWQELEAFQWRERFPKPPKWHLAFDSSGTISLTVVQGSSKSIPVSGTYAFVNDQHIEVDFRGAAELTAGIVEDPQVYTITISMGRLTLEDTAGKIRRFGRK